MTNEESTEEPGAENAREEPRSDPADAGTGDAGTAERSGPVNRTAFMPRAEIELSADEGFRIRLDKVRLADLFDQSALMMESEGQGCISAPGGPSC